MITVLVTGCGGAVGLSVVKALRKEHNDLRIIGVDADPYAAFFHQGKGENSVDKGYTISRAENPNYIPEIIKISSRENVDVIFPGTDAELEKLATSRTKITHTGAKIILSPLETIRICRDKWLTYQHLKESFPMVRSALPDKGIEAALKFTGLPAVVKPRKGWGSRQTYKIQSLDEAKPVMGYVHEPIIQKWLEGEEYTVDGLVNRSGKAICIVPRRRLKVLAGLSFQGVTVRDGKLIKLGQKVAENLEILGPFNFQARKINGEPRIFEINPRFAGTGILSVNAGVNIPLLAVKEICGIEVPSSVDFEEGIIISRYFEEIFFRNQEAKL